MQPAPVPLPIQGQWGVLHRFRKHRSTPSQVLQALQHSFLAAASIAATGGTSPRFYTRPPPIRSGPKAPGGGGGVLQPVGLAMPAMLIGLHKIPKISFTAAFATRLLSILDPNTHSNPSLG